MELLIRKPLLLSFLRSTHRTVQFLWYGALENNAKSENVCPSEQSVLRHAAKHNGGTVYKMAREEVSDGVHNNYREIFNNSQKENCVF